MDDVIERGIQGVKAEGYTVIPDFLSRQQLATVRALLAQIEETAPFGQENFGGTRTKRASNLLGRTRALDDIVIDPRLRELIGGVL
jgi:hypothetical protein